MSGTERAGQIVVEALVGTTSPVGRASQIVVEALSGTVATSRAAQSVIEVLVAAGFASQAIVEILLWNYEVPVPALYPTLPGLTFSVIKRPKFFTGIAKSTSGREVRVGYALNPLWEWDLTYNYLPDQRTESSASDSDLKTLVGFFLSQSGALQNFKFEDPDDHTVTRQPIATTDGVTSSFVLQRTYGGGSGAGTEPIGWVNLDQPFNVHFDETPIDPSLYEVLTTIGSDQQIRFPGGAPFAGSLLTVTMSYYYNVRFSADTYDFEKFMDKLWSTQTVTLASQRS